MNKWSTRKIVMTAMLGALSTILMALEFPVPLMPPFIKMDISELPALIASFSMGPMAGVLVCLIKNLVHVTQTVTGGAGELSNFLLGVCFVVPAGFIYQKIKNRKGALIACLVGAMVMAVLSLPVNYFISYPAYSRMLPVEQIISLYEAIRPGTDGLLECLIVFNIPFNFIKGLLVGVLTFFIYKPLSRFIKGNY